MKRIAILALGVLVFPLFNAQAAINSLNGLTGATQTFVNDTNVKITSTGTTHTLGWTGVLQAARGGTGAGTFTLNGVILGNTTGALNVTTAGTNGQLFLGVTSGAPAFATLSGDASITNAGVLTIASNAVALSADTTGNYVATITNGSGISGSSAIEGGTPTLSLGNLTADWIQSGAFNLVLNNSASNIKILENGASPTLYGNFDVADLSSSDKTYTFPDATGTVITTGNISDVTGLIDSQVSDTLTASKFIGTGSSSDTVDLATAEVNGALSVSNGGTGLSSIGSSNQVLGVNNAGSGIEYKTISGTTNQISVTHAVNSITLSLPQDIHSAATPTFAGLTINGLVESTSGGFKFPDGSTQATAATPSSVGGYYTSFISSVLTNPGETFYMGPKGKTSNNFEAEVIIPNSGTIKNLYVQDSYSGCNVTYTVLHNGSSTSISTSTTSPGGSANDTTHTVSVSAGDIVDIQAHIQNGCNNNYTGKASLLIE